jgi:hypothetical protein
MKLTEEQIWKCNKTINYEGGEVVDAVHICLDHQNVVDFARSIEREIGFAKAELWTKRINAAVLAEREACAAKAQQEPVAWMREERNFCSRCGKRTADLTTIHTCTPRLKETTE